MTLRRMHDMRSSQREGTSAACVPSSTTWSEACTVRAVGTSSRWHSTCMSARAPLKATLASLATALHTHRSQIRRLEP